ncbi:hypothetical protein FGG08_005530 [Glutinoglossum americanum]|uniref:SH3 domain-containing protein n=1 Tax=Glutinoglossum americanum TaxID=1670608 RepID=A0A9P8L1C4_9PEZI|nr:hypothetical protein FGG08_005530 [Glutinoglossum americanum]
MAHRVHREHSHRRLDGRDALPNPIPDPMANPLPIADPSPKNAPAPAPAPAPVQTVVSVVYVTAAKTFSGPVAGYTTIAVGSPLLNSAPPPPQTFVQPTKQPTNIVFDSSLDRPDSTTKSSSKTSVGTVLATTALVNSSPTVHKSPTSTSVSLASASGAPLSQSSPSGGLSGAAKAGIVLAVLVGIGLLLAVVLLFCRRKRKQNESYSKASDEGSSFAQSGAAFAGSNYRDSTRSTDTARIAPQLSLRPVTQFLPNLDANRKSAGNPLAMAGGASNRGAVAGQGRTATSPPSSGNGAWERKTPSPTSDPANPFGNHAEPSDRSIAASPAAGSSVDSSAFPAPSNGAAVGATGFAAAAAAGAVAGAAGARQKPPPPLDLNNGRKFSADASASQISLPLSDAGTDTSRGSAMTAGTPIVATAAAATAAVASVAGPNPPVHRVQLDFKPSMGDELGLRAGQLVRLLHEYDDGWALCIRLDRSQQGVCPRTCLSKQPVKPRPNSPRSGPSPAMRTSPQGRPMAPQVQPARPASPAGSARSLGPYAGQQARPMNPYAGPPRSLSPGPLRPQSPVISRPQSPVISRPQTPVDQRSRANSVGQVSPPIKEISGLGPSKMNPNNVANAERPPQRIPTVLRSGSPRPSPPQSGVPTRKPLPEHEVGHAI